MKAIVSVCLGCTTSPLKLSLSSKIKKWNSDQLNEQTIRSYRFKIYRENSWFCIDKWAFHSVGHRKNSLKKKKTQQKIDAKVHTTTKSTTKICMQSRRSKTRFSWYFQPCRKSNTGKHTIIVVSLFGAWMWVTLFTEANNYTQFSKDSNFSHNTSTTTHLYKLLQNPGLYLPSLYYSFPSCQACQAPILNHHLLLKLS